MAEAVPKIGEEEIKMIGRREEEIKMIDRREGEGINEENKDEAANSSIAGINLVLVLSFLSLSAEEEIEEKQGEILNHKKKQSWSIRRREQVHEFRAAERQTSKIHTKIRDCRHCRRM